MEGKKLAFIVGCPRSGTTWLQLTLAESDHVVTGPESYLFSHYLKSARAAWDSIDRRRGGISGYVPEDRFYEWLSWLPEMFFEALLRSKPRAGIVVEKTPGHGEHGANIIKVYPESYFIHMIRDPRAVVASMRAAAASWGAHWAPRQIKTACDVWTSRINCARGIAALTPRYREVFYQKLHADPVGEVGGVFEWLGQPVEPSKVEEFVRARSLERVRPPASAEEDIDKHFFRRGEVDSWRRELSGSDIAIIERLTRKQMAELGYEPVAGRRDRMIAKARLKAYRAADRLAKAARAGADRLKP